MQEISITIDNELKRELKAILKPEELDSTIAIVNKHQMKVKAIIDDLQKLWDKFDLFVSELESIRSTDRDTE